MSRIPENVRDKVFSMLATVEVAARVKDELIHPCKQRRVSESNPCRPKVPQSYHGVADHV